MELLIWGGVFAVSLSALVKGADWLLEGAKKVGIALGFSPFVVGVLLVGFGTSLPELASSVAGVLKGAFEIPAANAIGSNIANILLIVGIASLVARGKMIITKNIIDLELPFLILSTFFFVGVAYDGAITTVESVLLLIGFVIYMLYTFLHQDADEVVAKNEKEKTPVSLRDVLFLLIGLALLVFGSRYLIDSVIAISGILGIAVGIITIVAVAVGTSLPELLVSVKAALQGNAEVAIGNIFGSNIFNILLVVGLPGMFVPVLTLDSPTLLIGLPALIAVSVFFVVSGLSKRIHTWEGLFYLLVYALFTMKLFGIA